MIKFLADADLLLWLYQRIRELSYAADDVRHIGLGQASDQQIFDYAIQHGYCLISRDSPIFSGSLSARTKVLLSPGFLETVPA
jgi:predicted nuclease of predicted toxin-antitoxin system